MKIFIGSDHRGFALKAAIIQKMPQIEWTDLGVFSNERSDYPIIAQAGAHAIKSGMFEQGVLICGSGIGVSIAANRSKGVFAGLCWNAHVARAAKEDDNINVLVLPADFLEVTQASDIVSTWLSAQFKGGTYQRRRDLVDNQN